MGFPLPSLFLHTHTPRDYIYIYIYLYIQIERDFLTWRLVHWSAAAFCPNSCFIIVSVLREAVLNTGASVVQGTHCSPICSFICQDQLLVLAVFLSCSLERGGSQLERGARGYALSPLCGETHGGLERLCRCREEEWEGTHLRGLIFFHKSQTYFILYLYFSEGHF